jgi:glutamate-ammonia-ligase adenylyltransferase
MRARIFAAKAPDGDWEAKVGPGRLQDIELLAQSFALRAGSPARKIAAQIRLGAQIGAITAAEAETLAAATRFLWRLQAGGRLLTDRALDMQAIGEGGRAFLQRETGTEGLDALAAALANWTDAAAAIIDRVLADATIPEPGQGGKEG